MLKDLLEKRSEVETRLRAAHEANDDSAFTVAETEMRDIDAKIKRARTIEALERFEPGTPINGDAKLESEIRSKFSLARAVAGAGGLAVDWGFEREVQPELAKRAGAPAKGIYVPTEIFETRVQTVGTNADGGYLVGTDNRADLYISVLVNSSVVRSLGARVLAGLSSFVDIPKETGSPVIGWVGENSALSTDGADFGQVSLAPRHAGALSEWSRNMVMQASPDIEQLLRQMLARDLALAIDLAAIKGGGSNEPTGVLSTSGIQTQAYATSIFATAAEMVAKADISNVAARRSFLSTNTVKKIAAKALDSNKQPLGIAKVFNNEPTTFSNQVPATLGSGSDHGLIYGDWSELLLGIWSEIDILVNPFESTAYSKGNISIRAMSTVDCAVRHAEAFVSATGVTSSAAGIA